MIFGVITQGMVTSFRDALKIKNGELEQKLSDKEIRTILKVVIENIEY